MTHRVVLVDDVPEIRQILRLILEHAGPFEVVGEGRNGHEAMTLAADLQPDLLVMDVEMRGGPTGWEVLPRIRESSPRTAVVILSGSAARPMGTGEAMADGVLEKGLSPQELNDALLAILGKPSRMVAPETPAPAPRTVPAAGSETDGRDLLSVILDAMTDAVVVLSPEGVVRSWNPGAERHFGVPAAEAVGEPFARWCTEPLRHAVERAAAGERFDGPSLAAVPLPDGVVVLARDLSATQESDQAMAWAVAEIGAKGRMIEQARRELEGFASVASHDIAQPLQVAYGYLEMVRSEFREGMDETAAEWIDAAAGSLERMRRLVQDILSYARGGNQEIVAHHVSVEEAALAAAATVSDLAEARGAEITLRPPLPIVSGHAEFVAKVLEQLLANAVHFVPEGRPPVIEVSAEEGADEWVVTVTDNGTGIGPELADRVFDVFFRTGSGADRGAGLGLSLARKLVERMGGRIWVEGRAEGAEGTEIRFALPKDVT